MELSDLSVFKAVVETGGITPAANRLNRVPSNVTARIQKLEQELGKSLFIREGNRLRISHDGEHLLGYANDILHLAQEAVEGLNGAAPSGRLKLGAIEMAAATRLVEPLKVYHQRYPDVDIEISTSPTGELIDQVLNRSLDMALVSDAPKDSRLVRKPMFKETLVLVSDTNQSKIKTPKDLGNEPTVLGFSMKCAYRNLLTEWLKGDQVVAKVIEINSYHALLTCVTAGMGVGISPQAVIDIYPYAEGIKVHPLPAKLRYSTTYLIWRNDSVKANMTAFSDCMQEHKNF